MIWSSSHTQLELRLWPFVTDPHDNKAVSQLGFLTGKGRMIMPSGQEERVLNLFSPLLQHKEIRLLIWLVSVWDRDRALQSAGRQGCPPEARFCAVGFSALASALQEPQKAAFSALLSPSSHASLLESTMASSPDLGILEKFCFYLKQPHRTAQAGLNLQSVCSASGLRGSQVCAIKSALLLIHNEDLSG